MKHFRLAILLRSKISSEGFTKISLLVVLSQHIYWQFFMSFQVLFLASTIVCGTSVPPTCPPNLFPHRANGEFHCCDFCSPGHYVVEYCNRSNKTRCAQCPANQLYDERNEYRQCYPWVEMIFYAFLFQLRTSLLRLANMESLPTNLQLIHHMKSKR